MFLFDTCVPKQSNPQNPQMSTITTRWLDKAYINLDSILGKTKNYLPLFFTETVQLK